MDLHFCNAFPVDWPFKAPYNTHSHTLHTDGWGSHARCQLLILLIDISLGQPGMEMQLNISLGKYMFLSSSKWLFTTTKCHNLSKKCCCTCTVSLSFPRMKLSHHSLNLCVAAETSPPSNLNFINLNYLLLWRVSDSWLHVPLTANECFFMPSDLWLLRG